MKNNATGIDLNGVHLGVSLESSQTNIREVGIVGGKLIQGGFNRWGNDAFEHLGNLLLPNNLSTLEKQGDQSSFLPAWALWTKIKSNESGEDKSSSHDATTVGGIVDEVLKTYDNGHSNSGKSALVIDDDLSSETQDRLAQFIRIRGLNLVLLPRSVAIFLAWAKTVAPGEKRKLGGKKAVVINLRVDGMTATEIEMEWLQSNWSKKEKDSSPDQGYLIPCLKKRDKRIVGEYRYLPLDIEALQDMDFPGVHSDSKFWHAWAQLIKDRVSPKEKEEFPSIAFGDNGWVTRIKKPNSNNHEDLKSMWNHFLGQKISIPQSFSIKDLESTFNQISNAIEPERIIIVDETYGLIGTEWRSIAKESFGSLPDFSLAKPEVGAAIFASRLNQNLPTYYEELPDVKILAPVGKSRKREEISLVDTESDYARGGKIYTNEPYDAILKPTENITLNFLIEGEKKHKECSFIETPEKVVEVGLKVEVTASQGYGKIEFVPKEESVKRAYGSISIEWDQLKEGHIELDDEFNYPPSSEISPDGKGFALWSPTRVYVSENESILGAIRDLLDGKGSKESLLNSIHQGCRNGVSLGSDWENGINTLVEHGTLDLSVMELWKSFREFVKTELDNENNLGSKLTQRLVQVGSHFWKASPQNIRNDLKWLLCHPKDTWALVTYIEAAGRAFHQKDEIDTFIECFLKHVSDEGTSARENWFKALSFLFRTNEEICGWIDYSKFETIAEAILDRLIYETQKLRKSLGKPYRYCLLSSLYLLRMREVLPESNLFELGIEDSIQENHNKLAEALMSSCLSSWLVQPWIPVGSYMGEIQRPSPGISEEFIKIFLWPSEIDSIQYGEVESRVKMLKDIKSIPQSCNEWELISRFVTKGMVIENGDNYEIGNLDEEYDLFRGEKAKSALQPSIAKFLLGKAGGSDIRLIEKGADQST